MVTAPAGTRRHFLRIDRMVQTTDETGAVTNTPVLFCEVWARLEPLAAREFFAAGAIRSEIDHRAVAPAADLEGVTTEMQVVDDAGGVFEIVAPPRDVEGLGVETELLLRVRD